MERESRPLRRAAKPGAGMERGADADSSTICRCRVCGRTSADRPGFAGRHYPGYVIVKALMYVARGMSPMDAARTINDEYGMNLTGRTVRRWVDDYRDMIAAYTEGLKIHGAEAVSMDEKESKSNGRRRWTYGAICLKSRFIIATYHSSEKLGFDATDFFRAVLRRLGKPLPLLWINDGLGVFMTGFKNALRTDPPSTLHIKVVAVGGTHVNNNIHERHNGSVTPYVAGARGFHSDEPGLLGLHTIYHNFLRPHRGIVNMTPAEKAGIRMPGEDKLLALIRCAAASGFMFSWPACRTGRICAPNTPTEPPPSSGNAGHVSSMQPPSA